MTRSPAGPARRTVAPRLHRTGAVSEEDTAQQRVLLGAVASLPREATEAGRLLVGQRLTAELIGRVADAAAKPSKPLDNTDLTHPYRKKMTRVFVVRALRGLAGLPAMPGQGPGPLLEQATG